MPDNNHIYQIDDDSGINFRRYFFLVISYWYLFLIFIALGLSVSYLVNRYTEPVYQVSCSLIVGQEVSPAERFFVDFFSNRNIRKTQQMVNNEVIKLNSFKLAHKTLQELDFDITYAALGRTGFKELKLYNHSPFIVIPDTNLINKIGHPVYITILDRDKYRLEINQEIQIDEILIFGGKFTHPSYNFTVKLKDPDALYLYPNKPNKYYFVFNDLNNLAQSYRNRLRSQTTGQESSVLLLSLDGNNIQQEVDYLNKLCDVYIESGLQEKNQMSENAVVFIDELLTSTLDSLNYVSSDIFNIKQANDIIDLSKEGDALFNKIISIQNEKSEVLLKVTFIRYLYNYLSGINDHRELPLPSVAGIADPVFSLLLNKLYDLYHRKSILQYSTEKDNPVYEINELEIVSAKESILQYLKNLEETTSIEHSDIDSRLIEANNEIRKLPLKEQKIINIQRQYDIHVDFYSFLLQKRTEAEIAKAANVPSNKVLDIARVENATRVKPNSLMNYVTGLLLGLIIPVVIIILREVLNDKILDKRYIVSNSNVPIIGTVGHNVTLSDLSVLENPKSSLSESFRGIRTNLNYFLTETNQKTVSITSTITSEGKTFCAINLAIVYAIANKKTLLLGLDLRKPRIHRIFGTDNESGLSTYLIGESTYQDIIKSTDIDNLFIATSGPVPPNPAELIDSEKMAQLIDEVKKDFDYIVIDTPPLAIVTDALLISKMADINIFVIRQGFSHQNVLNLINDLHNNAQLRNMSILLNDVKIKGYYAYRNYGYQYEYGYGYTSGYEDRGYYHDDKSRKRRLFGLFRSRS